MNEDALPVGNLSVEGIPQRNEIVTFIKQWFSYWPGEVAAFTVEEADWLFELGVIASPKVPTPGVMHSGAITDVPGLLATVSVMTDGGWGQGFLGNNNWQQGPSDLTGVSTIAQLASTMTTMLQGRATCAWDAGLTQLVITTTNTGATATIGFANAPTVGTDMSGPCRLRSGGGANIEHGTDG
jgi:hypothetical protein